MLDLERAGAAAPAIRFPDRAFTYGELTAAVDGLAAAIEDAGRVAIWAQSRPETAIAVAAALRAGVPAIPINPKAGERELAHLLRDSRPEVMLAGEDAALPAEAEALTRRLTVDLEPAGGSSPAPRRAGAAGAADPALIVYTSGTTGAPKGVVLSRGAVATNLDALFDAWRWTSSDALVHGLPLFHVHGLVLGILGPLRLGGRVEHLGRFDPAAVGAALERGGTMFFGVPTMYRRLADAATGDARLRAALAGARLLVSGSAGLPVVEHSRLRRLSGRPILERYGMTETLMITSARIDEEPRPGYVGRPVSGVEVRLRDDSGALLEDPDEEAIGEVEVRSESMFSGYLNLAEVTREALDGDWFKTGDLATQAEDGSLRIVGRRSTDLIKSGGYKIGAGEIEAALREHPAVDDAAVTGEPDPDLGERVVAWVVIVDGAEAPEAEELVAHVAGLLAPHKRPRRVNFLEDLPRNAMGKVQKARLASR